MNFVSLKNAFVTAAFLLAAGHTDITPAHQLSGGLGSRPPATDFYQVACFAEDGGPATSHLRMRVRDNAPVRKSMVSVQVHKGRVATNTTDPKDGDARYSRWVNNHGGDGVYNVLVNKSSNGAETYTLEYHCVSSTGIHTGTETNQAQNQ